MMVNPKTLLTDLDNYTDRAKFELLTMWYAKRRLDSILDDMVGLISIIRWKQKEGGRYDDMTRHADSALANIEKIRDAGYASIVNSNDINTLAELVDEAGKEVALLISVLK